MCYKAKDIKRLVKGHTEKKISKKRPNQVEFRCPKFEFGKRIPHFVR